MDNKLLSSRLREMATNTGTLNCLGCGYEHSCSTRGCAVLKKAAEIVESAPEWISVEKRKPEPGERVLLSDGVYIGEGWLSDNGILCRYVGRPIKSLLGIDITYWMPMPVPPGKEHRDV